MATPETRKPIWAPPGRWSSSRLWWVVASAVLTAILFASAAPGTALAGGNASRAAAFLESAQNSDGGFGAKQGGSSEPTATLWASLALLAGGKNPNDEFLKNGHSADQYLASHAGEMTSLEQLGLRVSGVALGAVIYRFLTM